MGITTTSQLIYDGNRHTVWQFTGICDGLGDETNALKVDKSRLQPMDVNKPITSLAILEIQYNISYGILQLLWDTDQNPGGPVPFLNLEGFDEISYRHMNGLPNGGGDTATGNILFSTIGFELNSTYSVVLEMRKKSKIGFPRDTQLASAPNQ